MANEQTPPAAVRPPSEPKQLIRSSGWHRAQTRTTTRTKENK